MQSDSRIKWDLDLIRRYDLTGPRYTSYPTAVQFDSSLTPDRLIEVGKDTADSSAPLSLYFHIPFCTHVCYYCGCNKIITRNKKRAEPYLDALYREIKHIAGIYSGDRIVDQLHWGGGTPTFISDDEMRELMNITGEFFNLRDDDEGDYSIEVDPREADPDRVKVLREIGFNRMSLGVQDVNIEVQEAVNRVQPLQMTRDILASARDHGFRSINIDLIYGLPHQTADSFKNTVDQVIELSPDRLSVFNYAHLPDRFRSQKHIIEEHLPSPGEKLAILENSINQLIDAGYVYIGMDHFAKPDDELAIAQRNNQLHRNFQGYTTHGECDLVAMGVSSISQIGDVYYQNEHDIKLYQEAVGARDQAVRRGVILHADDRIRRRVIVELICHFHLDPAIIEQEFGINFTEYFSDELEGLQRFADDGLITLKDGHIEVLAAGRLLIRSICMSFDAYIPKDQGTSKFSRII